MEKNDNMLRYEKAHDDVREIFESDKSLDERLNEFNDYLKTYVDNIDEEDIQLGNYQSHPHIKAPLSN